MNPGVSDRTTCPGNLCHVCASPKIAYWHTISPVNNPAVMINVCYCKRCAELIDKFEQDLYKWTEAKE